MGDKDGHRDWPSTFPSVSHNDILSAGEANRLQPQRTMWPPRGLGPDGQAAIAATPREAWCGMGLEGGEGNAMQAGP